MKRSTFCLGAAAMLYGAILPTANAVGEQTPLAGLDSLKALREGQMAKLVVHDRPRPRIDEPYRDIDGNLISLADHGGKVVLLNIWATWCPPCRAEMPSLDRLAGAMDGPDFQVVALSNDRGGVGRVVEFFDSIFVKNLKVMHDRGGSFSRQAAVLGLPVTLILDREGREIARMLGDADWDSPEARRLLARVIELTRETSESIRA